MLGIGISGARTLSDAVRRVLLQLDRCTNLDAANPRAPEPPRRNVITTTNREVTHEQYNQVTCDNVNDATTGRRNPRVPRRTAPWEVSAWEWDQRA